LCGEGSEEVPKQPRTTLFLDEEALFNMPGLLDSMAEGLILTPNNDSCTLSVQQSYNTPLQGVGPTVYGAHPL
jgi:hypothetical protein